MLSFQCLQYQESGHLSNPEFFLRGELYPWHVGQGLDPVHCCDSARSLTCCISELLNTDHFYHPLPPKQYGKIFINYLPYKRTSFLIHVFPNYLLFHFFSSFLIYTFIVLIHNLPSLVLSTSFLIQTFRAIDFPLNTALVPSH